MMPAGTRVEQQAKLDSEVHTWSFKEKGMNGRGIKATWIDVNFLVNKPIQRNHDLKTNSTEQKSWGNIITQTWEQIQATAHVQ